MKSMNHITGAESKIATLAENREQQ